MSHSRSASDHLISFTNKSTRGNTQRRLDNTRRKCLQYSPPLRLQFLAPSLRQVAMSKYRSVDVGSTLFGKVKLDPCCIACDRPFGPSGQVKGSGYCSFFVPFANARGETDHFAKIYIYETMMCSGTPPPSTRTGYSRRCTSSPVRAFATGAGCQGRYGWSTANAGYAAGECLLFLFHVRELNRCSSLKGVAVFPCCFEHLW